MAQVKFGSAGVTAQEIDISGPVTIQPTGVPAGIIGTSLKGQAFVPITVGIDSDFYSKFGKTDGVKFGPLAATEWLRNASSLTYLRVLGIGDGLQRLTDTNYAGSVNDAGFVVGEEQPNNDNNGALEFNPYANQNGVPGRTYFLGCFMSESVGSTVFSSAGIQTSTTAIPVIRGMLMAPSGVIIHVSSSAEGSDNSAPSSTLVASDATAHGTIIGSVVLTENSVPKQEFTLLLNGHKGTDSKYPNTIVASFDMTAPNYFANVLNTDPFKYQEAGHLLYANWDIHPSLASVTGSGIVLPDSGAFGKSPARAGAESIAFCTSGSLTRNLGSVTVPNFENFEDRFNHGKSPWVISQKFGGQPTNLFRIHTLDAGSIPRSNAFKVSIENIVQSTDPLYEYGTFDLILRSLDDKDETQIPLEQFRGLSLDPSNDRYICKVIGDLHTFFEFDRVETAQKLVIDGNYPNQSNLIRIEVSSDVEQQLVDATALPMGFRGIEHLVTSGTMPLTSPASTQHSVASILKRTVQPPLPLRQNITAGSGGKISVNPLLYWGVQFEHVTNLSTPNGSILKNNSIWNTMKYFPNFSTTNINVCVGDNSGEADTAELGIIDADRFCNNMFTLENIKVVTGSNGLADSKQWVNATYIRNGGIGVDDTAKTRALQIADLTTANRRYAKFSFIVQGGFNGTNIFDREESNLSNNAVMFDFLQTSRGGADGPNIKTWKKAIDIMKNPTNIDINVLAIPGLKHPIVTDYAVKAAEERFDTIYVMDIEEYDQSQNVVINSTQKPSVYNTALAISDRALDSSFAAAYYPDIIIKDPNTNTNVVAPASVAVLGAFALNDRVGHPWFAPAGMARGALPTTLETKVKLSKENLDTLYDVDINPLVAFPAQSGNGLNAQGGVVVWGQKTLQAAASALDRVNVRRLLLEVRRQVKEVALSIIFEPNRESTLAKFSASVTPRLQKIQAQSGMDKFKVVIDSSTTTQQDILNNTIRGKIFIKPTKSIEFVSLDFVVANNIPNP